MFVNAFKPPPTRPMRHVCHLPHAVLGLRQGIREAEAAKKADAAAEEAKAEAAAAPEPSKRA